MTDIKRTDSSRRSFFLRGSAALGAGLASATTGAGVLVFDEHLSLKNQLKEKTDQLEIMQDTNAIRELHQAYANHLNNHAYEDIVNLFADDGEVHINGSVFKGKDKGIRKLFVEQLGHGENSAGPNHNRLHPDQTQQQDTIEVAADRQTAKARFHCAVQASEPLIGEFSIIEMARLQGQGSRQLQESGVFETSYVKVGENWKIKQLGYRPIEQVDSTT